MSQQQNNGEKNNYSSSEENINHGKGLIVFLLLLSILTNLATGYYISTGASKTGGVDTTVSAFMEKYLVNEYEKAGGKENYDLLAKAQQLQMEDQIPQIKQFIASKQ